MVSSWFELLLKLQQFKTYLTLFLLGGPASLRSWFELLLKLQQFKTYLTLFLLGDLLHSGSKKLI